jgi:hypothetical protein
MRISKKKSGMGGGWRAAFYSKATTAQSDDSVRIGKGMAAC